MDSLPTEFDSSNLTGTSPEDRRTLLANGYEAIPIKGKYPTWTGWRQGDMTEERLSEIEAVKPDHTNTGIRTGHLAVVDIDLWNRDHAAAVSEAVQSILGESLVQRVGAKGVGLCYYNPTPIAKITISGCPPLADGEQQPVKALIEVLGQGQQVAAYGVHPDTGKAYQWINSQLFDAEPLTVPLRNLPKVTPDMLRKAATAACEKLKELGYTNVCERGATKIDGTGPRHPKADVPIMPLNMWFNIAKAESYLDTVPAVNGNQAAYDIACELRDFGVSDVECLRLMLDSSWNSRLQFKEGVPWPWGADELSEVVEHAYRYGQNRPGCKGDYLAHYESWLGEEGLNKLIGTYSDEGDLEDRPLSAAELADGDFPRAEHLWRDFILMGHPNSLDGDGGIGKTQLLIQIAVAVAAGRPLFGHDTMQMPVLLVLCEDNAGETKWRLRRVCEDFGVELRDLPLHIWCRPGDDSTLAVVNDVGEWRAGVFYEKLRERLKAIGPCLLGLDTVSDVAILDENKRLPVNTFAKQVLGALCREFDSTILITRHPSKASMADGSFYAGATSGNAAYRNRLAMEKVGDGNKRMVKVVKSNYGLKGNVDLYHLNHVLSAWSAVDENQRQAEEREAVLAVVSELRANGSTIVPSHGNGYKPKDLVPILKGEHGLDTEAKAVLGHLRQLEKAKRIYWQPSTSGKNARAATFEVGPPPDGEG